MALDLDDTTRRLLPIWAKPTPPADIEAGDWLVTGGGEWLEVELAWEDPRCPGRFGFDMARSPLVLFRAEPSACVPGAIVAAQVGASNSARARRLARHQRAVDDATHGIPPKGWEP